jgi:thioredoxin-related protein
MKFLRFTSIVLLGYLTLGFSMAANDKVGEFFGAKQTLHPNWFKESFLEFEEDIDEATANEKRLIVYFYQQGCPYCNKLVEENFTHPEISKKVQTHFDLVAINMWGDREVVQVGGRSFTEKSLAEALQVNFTPTLLFFDEKRQVALRLNGYYPIIEFNQALDYVVNKMESELSFPEYAASLKTNKTSGQLNQQKWILPKTYDLTSLVKQKPLAVLFEEPECENCNLLHDRTFAHPDAQPLLTAFNFIQLNRWSDTEIITPKGESLKIEQWAKDLGLGFSPSIVLFDENGDQIMVVDAMFKTFHILGVLDYVSSGAYKSEPNFQRFLSNRSEHIRSTGKDVNIWEY